MACCNLSQPAPTLPGAAAAIDGGGAVRGGCRAAPAPVGAMTLVSSSVQELDQTLLAGGAGTEERTAAHQQQQLLQQQIAQQQILLQQFMQQREVAMLQQGCHGRLYS